MSWIKAINTPASYLIEECNSATVDSSFQNVYSSKFIATGQISDEGICRIFMLIRFKQFHFKLCNSLQYIFILGNNGLKRDVQSVFHVCDCSIV